MHIAEILDGQQAVDQEDLDERDRVRDPAGPCRSAALQDRQPMTPAWCGLTVKGGGGGGGGLEGSGPAAAAVRAAEGASQGQGGRIGKQGHEKKQGVAMD